MREGVGTTEGLPPFRQIGAAIDVAVAALPLNELRHTARVASRCGGGADQVILAWLHDVVEAGWSEDLRERGFSDRVLEALDAITRREGEQYQPDYLSRVAANPLARLVKRADLKDHLSQTASLTDSLKLRYERAMEFLA